MKLEGVPLARLHFRQATSHKPQAGFSLIELLAVTAIIAMVSGVILMSNSKFGGKMLLQNLAYDIALSIRQAQVYGIAVKRSSTATYDIGYGIHLDTSSNAQYVLFGDTNNNGVYETGESVETTTIGKGFVVYKLCSTPLGSGSCLADPVSISTIDILFKRPEPDAKISAKVTGNTMISCTVTAASCQTTATILLRSPRGDISSVIVDQNGQITVQ